MSRRSFIFCAVFAVLLAVALTWHYARSSSKAEAEEQGWFICTRFNMSAIADAVSSYTQTNHSDIKSLTNILTYVKSGKLPEWSPVFICPNWFDVQMPARDYNNVSNSSELFTSIPLAANVSRCSYYMELCSSNELRVRCLYHTNVLNYTVKIK